MFTVDNNNKNLFFLGIEIHSNVSKISTARPAAAPWPTCRTHGAAPGTGCSTRPARSGVPPPTAS